jgi:uncharacterized protein YjbI with pentapeptide repeats
LTISGGRQLRADLTRTVGRYADFRGADMRRVRLLEADLIGAKLNGADLTDAEIDGPVAAPAGA